MCSTRHFYGQKSGERLTWLNLSVVDICFAGKLSGWREEDGVIQSAQEFFFFFISCPEEKSDCFDMSGKIVCCFIHPLGTCWTVAV